ncbi:MAG: HNH endonuclease [Polyangiaceae bacterium]
MTARTLVLTPWYVPQCIVSWQDAITLLYLKKAEAVVNYDEVVRSPTVAMALPAVIRLKTKVKVGKRSVKFSRINVYLRDGFACAYCSRKLPVSQLTYDHVIPRCRGGLTVWENIVTACYDCNAKKADKTLEEVGMRPRVRPQRPHSLPLPPVVFDVSRAPAEWQDFCQALPRVASSA